MSSPLGVYCCRKSEVNVIDAKTMLADPVAVVELPNRVPYGFHAFFVSEVSFKVIMSNLVIKMRNYRINSCLWIYFCYGFTAILSWLQMVINRNSKWLILISFV